MTHHSKYNYVVAVPGSADVLVYNFNTGAMLKLSPAQKVLFDLAPQFSQDHPVVRRWRELGFLADRDELEDLKEQVRKRYDGYAGRTDKVLRLTLHVTSACNFACPYCFQARRGGHMPKEVQDQVVRFAQAKLAQGGYERMTVDWFGGEPLLAADVIDGLGHRLMDAAAQRGAGFSSNIQTNGYLLDQAMVDLLEGVNCRFVVVTLDGYGPDHDQTRHLHGGAGTSSGAQGAARRSRSSCRGESPVAWARWARTLPNACSSRAAGSSESGRRWPGGSACACDCFGAARDEKGPAGV